MRVAVSNAGPLIHLSLVGLLDSLFKLYDVILIPQSVYDEIVVKGKEQGYSDAVILERAIMNEKIKVEKVKKENYNISSSKLHIGEINAIILALQLKIEIILIDDEEGRMFARKLGIKVIGTLGILIEFFKHGLLDLNEAIQYLRKINEIMYLSSDVYSFIENKLNDIARTKKMD